MTIKLKKWWNDETLHNLSIMHGRKKATYECNSMSIRLLCSMALGTHSEYEKVNAVCCGADNINRRTWCIKCIMSSFSWLLSVRNVVRDRSDFFLFCPNPMYWWNHETCRNIVCCVLVMISMLRQFPSHMTWGWGGKGAMESNEWIADFLPKW